MLALVKAMSRLGLYPKSNGKLSKGFTQEK